MLLIEKLCCFRLKVYYFICVFRFIFKNKQECYNLSNFECFPSIIYKRLEWFVYCQ